MHLKLLKRFHLKHHIHCTDQECFEWLSVVFVAENTEAAPGATVTTPVRTMARACSWWARSGVYVPWAGMVSAARYPQPMPLVSESVQSETRQFARGHQGSSRTEGPHAKLHKKSEVCCSAREDLWVKLCYVFFSWKLCNITLQLKQMNVFKLSPR